MTKCEARAHGAPRPPIRRLAARVARFRDAAVGLTRLARKARQSSATSIRSSRAPLLGDAVSYTMSGGAAVRRRLSDNAAMDRNVDAVSLSDKLESCLADHAVTFRVLPLSATETALTTKWLVHKYAVEGVDSDSRSLSTCGPKPTIKIAGSWRKTHAASAPLHSLRQQALGVLAGSACLLGANGRIDSDGQDFLAT
jgi:hypothetical protein